MQGPPWAPAAERQIVRPSVRHESQELHIASVSYRTSSVGLTPSLDGMKVVLFLLGGPSAIKVTMNRTSKECRLVPLLWLLIACVAQSGCDAYRHCTGRYKECYGSSPSDFCTSLKGCQWVPGCGPPGNFCFADGYSQADCEGYPWCVWSENKCWVRERCDLKTDPATCTGVCTWSLCTGTAKQCSDYPVDACPASEDCYVETNGI